MILIAGAVFLGDLTAVAAITLPCGSSAKSRCQSGSGAGDYHRSRELQLGSLGSRPADARSI